MKKLVFVAFIFVFTLSAKSQRLAVRWVEKFKAPDGLYQNLQFMKAVPSVEDGLISVYRKINKSLYDNDYVLVKLNAKLDAPGDIKLEYPANGNEGMIDVLKGKQTNYILEYKVKGNKMAELYLTPINLKTLKKEISTKKIVDLIDNDLLTKYDGETLAYSVYLDVLYSPDSSKILLNYYAKTDAENKMESLVLSNAGQVLYNAIHTWNTPSENRQMQKPYIDNDGKCYFTWRNYAKSFNKEVEKGEGDQIPSFTSHLMVVDKDVKTQYSFETEGKYLNDMAIGYNKDKKPIVMGTYKDKYDGRINGVFTTPAISTDEKISNLIFTAFPDGLQKKIELDLELKPGKPGLTNDYYVGSTICGNNGVNYMVSEFFKQGNSENAAFYEKGDLVVTTFKSDGTVVFQGLPRRQSIAASLTSNEYLAPNEFLTMIVDNKLVVLYGDVEENAMQEIKEKPIKFKETGKTVVLGAVVNAEGKLLGRKMVFSHLDLEGFIFNYKLCSFRTNTYAIFATKPNNAKDGMVLGLLNAK